MSDQDKVTLRCLGCGREKRVPRDPTDPSNVAIIQIGCGKCDQADSMALYLDAYGRRLDADGELIASPGWQVALLIVTVVTMGFLIYDLAD